MMKVIAIPSPKMISKIWTVQYW